MPLYGEEFVFNEGTVWVFDIFDKYLMIGLINNNYATHTQRGGTMFYSKHFSCLWMLHECTINAAEKRSLWLWSSAHWEIKIGADVIKFSHDCNNCGFGLCYELIYTGLSMLWQ